MTNQNYQKICRRRPFATAADTTLELVFISVQDGRRTCSANPTTYKLKGKVSLTFVERRLDPWIPAHFVNR